MLSLLTHDLLWALLLLTPMKIAVLLAMVFWGKRESRVVAGFWGLLIGAVVVSPGWYWLALSWREKTTVEGVPGLITAVVELIAVAMSVVLAAGSALLLSSTLGGRGKQIRLRWIAIPAALYGALLVTALVIRWPVYHNEIAWSRAGNGLAQVGLEAHESKNGNVLSIRPEFELSQRLILQRLPVKPGFADAIVEHGQLEYLRIDQLNITDADLQRIGQLQQLTTLEIGSDLVTDSGVAALGNLSRLSFLTLKCPALTDASLTTLRQLMAIEYLNLEGVPITDQGLMQLRDLPQLNFILVDSPHLSQEGVDEFKRAKFGVAVGLPDERDPVTGMSLGQKKLPSRDELQRKPQM